MIIGNNERTSHCPYLFQLAVVLFVTNDGVRCRIQVDRQMPAEELVFDRLEVRVWISRRVNKPSSRLLHVKLVLEYSSGGLNDHGD